MKKVAAILFIFVFLFFSFGMQFLMSEARAGCCSTAVGWGWCLDYDARGLHCEPAASSTTVRTCGLVADVQACRDHFNSLGLRTCKNVGDGCDFGAYFYADDEVCSEEDKCQLPYCCTANVGCFQVTEQACRDNYGGTSYTTNAECQQKCKFPTPPPGGGTDTGLVD